MSEEQTKEILENNKKLLEAIEKLNKDRETDRKEFEEYKANVEKRLTKEDQKEDPKKKEEEERNKTLLADFMNNLATFTVNAKKEPEKTFKTIEERKAELEAKLAKLK